MALDSDNVRVAVTGAVYVAPTGTAAPSYSDDALNVAFTDLGYVSSDGISESFDKSTTQIRSWQDGSLVREIVSEGTYSVTMTFIETNQDVVELYFGSSLASGSLSIDPRATGGRQSFVIDVIDGTNIERTYIAAGEITSVGERTLASGEAIGYEVTITAYADATEVVATKLFSAFGSVEP
jgi:Ethanolamine utilization protein EutJ (predicted chaperonin)